MTSPGRHTLGRHPRADTLLGRPPGQTPHPADPPGQTPNTQSAAGLWDIYHLYNLGQKRSKAGGMHPTGMLFLYFVGLNAKWKRGFVFKFRVKNIYCTCVHGLYKLYTQYCTATNWNVWNVVCVEGLVCLPSGSCLSSFLFHECGKVNAVADLKGGMQGTPLFQLFNFMQFWQKSCQTIG